MKMLKKSFVLVISLLMSLTLLASCSKEKKEEDKKIYSGTHKEIIDEFFEDHSSTAAGMMVGVFDKNGTIYEGYYGYSDIANKTKMDENTVVVIDTYETLAGTTEWPSSFWPSVR